MMSKKWSKEEDLKQLKSDLAALDRKIQAEIAPSPKKPTAWRTSRRNTTQPLRNPTNPPWM